MFGLLGVWVNECVSRGTIRLASPDPLVDPIVEENMLDAPSDLARMRDGVRRLIEIARHPADARGRARSAASGSTSTPTRPTTRSTPGCSTTVGDAQHASSTCRMGDPSAPTTVVDPECRVLGVDGLRVIDASIMPSVVRANTHLTTVMIAERMAERLAL